MPVYMLQTIDTGFPVMRYTSDVPSLAFTRTSAL